MSWRRSFLSAAITASCVWCATVVQSAYRQEQAPRSTIGLVNRQPALKQADYANPDQAKPADADAKPESPDHRA